MPIYERLIAEPVVLLTLVDFVEKPFAAIARHPQPVAYHRVFIVDYIADQERVPAVLIKLKQHV